MTAKVFLSIRNVQTLLNKLDRNAAGDASACTIVKRDNVHPVYPQTMSACRVTASETVQLYDRTTAEHIVVVARQALVNLLAGLGPIILTDDHDRNIQIDVVEDDQYYTDRLPGWVHPFDDPGKTP